MSVVIREAIVEEAVSARPAVTKPLMVITMSGEEKQLCEECEISRSFLRSSAVLIPALALAASAFLLHNLGGLSLISALWKDWNPGLCTYARDCTDANGDDAGAILLLIAMTGSFFLWGVIALGVRLADTANTVEKTRQTLLKQMGWDGITEYELEVPPEQPES